MNHRFKFCKASGGGGDGGGGAASPSLAALDSARGHTDDAMTGDSDESRWPRVPSYSPQHQQQHQQQQQQQQQQQPEEEKRKIVLPITRSPEISSLAVVKLEPMVA